MNRLLLGVLIAAAAGPVHAESLWKKAEGGSRNIYADHRAHTVGDIVTVIIQETSSVTKERETELKKSSSADAQLEIFRLLGLDQAKYPRSDGGTPQVKYKSDRAFKGEADHKSKEEFTKTMAAMVIEVMPNGNLIVQGTSDMVIDDDISTVTVTGIIRAEDITAGNTVLSQKIMNARINFQAKGPMKRTTRRGWLDRFLDRIWPF